MEVVIRLPRDLYALEEICRSKRSRLNIALSNLGRRLAGIYNVENVDMRAVAMLRSGIFRILVSATGSCAAS